MAHYLDGKLVNDIETMTELEVQYGQGKVVEREEVYTGNQALWDACSAEWPQFLWDRNGEIFVPGGNNTFWVTREDGGFEQVRVRLYPDENVVLKPVTLEGVTFPAPPRRLLPGTEIRFIEPWAGPGHDRQARIQLENKAAGVEAVMRTEEFLAAGFRWPTQLIGKPPDARPDVPKAAQQLDGVAGGHAMPVGPIDLQHALVDTIDPLGKAKARISTFRRTMNRLRGQEMNLYFGAQSVGEGIRSVTAAIEAFERGDREAGAQQILSGLSSLGALMDQRAHFNRNLRFRRARKLAVGP